MVSGGDATDPRGRKARHPGAGCGHQSTPPNGDRNFSPRLFAIMQNSPRCIFFVSISFFKRPAGVNKYKYIIGDKKNASSNGEIGQF